jgi:putative oxidoreductase
MNRIAAALSRLQPVGLLLLRVWLGLAFALLHGLGKLQNAQDFIEGGSIAKFPLPALFGWAAILAEFLGGLLLAAGLLTRVAAFALFGTMVGAFFVVHADDPMRVRELAATYGLLALLFVFHGGGPVSVDRLLGRAAGGRSGS